MVWAHFGPWASYFVPGCNAGPCEAGYTWAKRYMIQVILAEPLKKKSYISGVAKLQIVKASRLC